MCAKKSRTKPASPCAPFQALIDNAVREVRAERRAKGKAGKA
jgi:hypothetical protein